MGKKLLFILFLILAVKNVYAQQLNNLRIKFISTRKDTIALDTLSIVPNSFFIIDKQSQMIDTSAFRLDVVNSFLIWNKSSVSYKNIKMDSLEIHYRVFSESFAKKYAHKNYDNVLKNMQAAQNPYIYSSASGAPDFFKTQGLTKQGSISRGISFGNTQDVFVNSSLNLQLSGKLNDNIDILAAITDQNVPVQPEGNTQQLQDFDKVFIQLSDKQNKLIAGDFELQRPNSYFMNFYAKAQGASFSTILDVQKDKDGNVTGVNKIMAAAAVSKGTDARNQFNGTEGNQGPYRLTGNNGETYIIIIAGSEKVYLDGELMVRGQQNDYVIDYNNDEVTFTPKHIMTEDMRISVEFEYSDQNYARSLLFFNDDYTNKKLHLNFNFYSQEDAKNQPSQTLDSTQIALLASVGDSINKALYPSADSVPYNSNEILYAKTDTIVQGVSYPNVYYYTTDTTKSYWLVTFSITTANGGDYVQATTSTANGQVYMWVAPVNGVHQGNYIAASLLVTPKKQQMYTFGADYQLSKHSKVSMEMALSNYDVNLFSNVGKQNDVGYAMHAAYINSTPLKGNDTLGWVSTTSVGYEYAQQNFTFIERYRAVEFDRDWNLTSTTPADESILTLKTGLSNKTYGSISYEIGSFTRGDLYDGLHNMITTNLTWDKFHLIASGSYLNTDDQQSLTQYYKHLEDLSKSFSVFVVGVRDEEEHDVFYKPGSDSLYGNSFAFKEYTGYIGLADSSKSSFRLDYKQRTDYAPANMSSGEPGTTLNAATVSDDIDFTSSFGKSPNNQLKTTTTYRRLSVEDTSLTTQAPSKILLNRIQYNLVTLKGILSTNTYYEVGTGQEPKESYTFLQVAPGTGVYQWIDFNHDGIQQLNEFVIAAFQSDADYVKVLITTNEFVPTRTNAFSEVLNINPGANSKGASGQKDFISRFTNQMQLQLNNKTLDQDPLHTLNPFASNVQDTSTISTNTSLRNSLFYNRTNSVYGGDYTYQQLNTKSLLTDGYEFRVLTTNTLNVRWNVSHAILLSSSFQEGDKQNSSQLFTANDYDIISQQVAPKVTYQIGTAYRVALTYTYAHRLNTESINDTSGQESFSNTLQVEGKYSAPKAGNFTVHISYTGIKFNADPSSPMAYDMLDGLQPGGNFVWGVALMKNLNKSMQLTVSYDGRQSQGVGIVNTANVQMRALF